MLPALLCQHDNHTNEPDKEDHLRPADNHLTRGRFRNLCSHLLSGCYGCVGLYRINQVGSLHFHCQERRWGSCIRHGLC